MPVSDRNSTDLDPRRVVKSSSSRPDRLDEAITNPGAVKINVKGAFIAEDEPRSKSPARETDGVHYESQDIRLPHHTGVVSHIAADVGSPFFAFFAFFFFF
jgi:type II pantothenate kinase